MSYGEGKIDRQTLLGKTPYGVAKLAHPLNVPTIAIAGCVDGDVTPLYDHGFSAVFSIIATASPLKILLKQSAKNTEKTCANIARLLYLHSKQ